MPVRGQSASVEIIPSFYPSSGPYKHFGPVGLIQLDAHGDTWSGCLAITITHGTPVDLAIEEGLIEAGHALQVGLRGRVYSEHDFDFARENSIKIVTSEEFHEVGLSE